MKERAGKAISTCAIIILSLAICSSLVQFGAENTKTDVHPKHDNEINEYTSSLFLDENVDKTNSGVPCGLSAEEWGSIQNLMRKAEYYPTKNGQGDGYGASNPEHQFGIIFDDGAAMVTPSSGHDWWWHLAPFSCGYSGTLLPLGAKPNVRVHENLIEFAYNRDFAGWYINSEKGLEHGFTLSAPPQGTTHGNLVIEMDIDTSLEPREITDKGDIVFLDRSGEEILKYGKLLVTDSRGCVLPSSLHLSANIITIAIEDSDAVYPITVDPVVVNEDAQLTASDGAEMDWFGCSVSISGNTVVVGANGADVGLNDDQGAAYVFERNQSGGSNWTQIKKLTSSDGQSGDFFGRAVSISYNTIVVGADLSDPFGNDRQGSAYVFERNLGGPDNWGQVVKLTASNGTELDIYGASVCIQGDTIVIGGYNHEGSEGDKQGSVYIYERNFGGPENWGETKELRASDGRGYDAFGRSVYIDNDRIVVGATGDDMGLINGQGSVYIFERDYGGPDNWGEVKKITSSDGDDWDGFGSSVSLSGDVIAVGVSGDDIGSNIDQGSAYIFERDYGGPGNWGEVKKLFLIDGEQSDWFGCSISINGDTIVVGADYRDVGGNIGQGAAYTYERNYGGANNWGQVKMLTASDGEDNDDFGQAVYVSSDMILVGAHTDDIGANIRQGSAYVFYLNATGSNLTIMTLDDTTAVEDLLYSTDYDAYDPGAGNLTWSLWTDADGWLNINSSTGVLSGIPDNTDVGSWTVNVTVENGTGGMDWSNFTLVVSNAAPVITTADDTTAPEDSLYSVDYNSDDDSQGTITWGISYTETDGWLTIDPTTGLLSGTPDNTDVGSWKVNVTVDDGNGGIGWSNFTVVVSNAAPAINTADDTTATEDSLYSLDYDSDDDFQGTITWNISYTETDGWLAIDPTTGLLSGIPDNTDVGSWKVNVTVDDGNGGIGWSNFTLVVSNVPPTIITADDETAYEDSFYLVDYDSDDDFQGIIIWNISFTETDGWLTINSTTGILSGIPDNTDVGSWRLNVTVDDGNGGIDWSNFTLVVSNVPPTIITAGDETAYEDSFYFVAFNSDDDLQGTITWNVSYTDTDGWLTIDPITGLLSGIPDNTDVGSWRVNVTVDDGNGGMDWSNFSLEVSNAPPIIITADDETADEDSFYFVDYDSDDDGEGTIAWSISYTDTDGWLTINSTTGILSGTPDNTDVGSWRVNVTVDDGNGGIGWSNFTLVVSNVPPTIITAGDETADEDSFYFVDYDSDDDGAGTITWNLKTDATWLSMDINGWLNGTPDNSDVGIYGVNVSVDDGNGGKDHHNFSITVANVNDPPLISTSDISSTSEDALYTVHYNATDIDPTEDTLTWALETNATWLSMDSNGWLNGTPDNSDVGIYGVNVSVDDGNGGMDYHNLILTVDNIPLIITTGDVVLVDEDELYSNDYDSDDDGQGTITWNLKTNATWLSLDGNGWLNGTPDNSDVGSCWVNVSVDDGNGGMDYHNFSITVFNVNDPPWISTSDISSASEDALYAVHYNATDIDPAEDTLTWAFETNATWLSIDSNGWLNGTPDNSEVGSYWMNVSVDDGNGGMDYHNFTLTINNVNDPPVITTTDIIYSNEDDFYSNDYNASDIDFDPDTLKWALYTNATGGWLSIDPLTGILSGNPDNSHVGMYRVNVSVDDGNGGADYHNFVLIINNVPPTIITPNVETILNGTNYFIDYDSTDKGQGTITWSLKTNATWLSMDSDTGILFGVPTASQVGYYWVNISIDDGNGGSDSTAFTLTVLLDTDGDGTPNQEDGDDDNDGVLDENDYFPLDPVKWKKPKGMELGIAILIIILIVVIILIIFLILFIKGKGNNEPIEEHVESNEPSHSEKQEEAGWDDFVLEEKEQPPSHKEEKRKLPPPPPP